MRKGVRARRVVRRFELWPVARVAFFFHLLCYLLTLGVLGLLWSVNSRLGTVDKAQKLLEQYGFGQNFKIHGDVLFRLVASVGGVFVLIATVATITLAFFYNGISLIMGGIVVSVLEESPASDERPVEVLAAHASGDKPSKRRARRRRDQQVPKELRGRRKQKKNTAGVQSAVSRAPVVAGVVASAPILDEPLPTVSTFQLSGKGASGPTSAAAVTDAERLDATRTDGTDWTRPSSWLEESVSADPTS